MIPEPTRWMELCVFRWDAAYAEVAASLGGLFSELPLVNLRSYLDTDWWRGPHVSVCFEICEPMSSNDAETLVQKARAAVALCRPAVYVDPNQYYDLHHRLAQYERRPQPLFPWCADGSVSLRELQPRDSSADPNVTMVVRKFHVNALETDIRLFTSLRDGKIVLDTYALDLLVTVAGTFTDSDIRATLPSFASHAMAYLGMDAPGGTEERWSSAYEKNREGLVRHVESLIQTRSSSTDDLVSRTVENLDSVTQGLDSLSILGGNSFPEWNVMSPAPSEFHARLAENSAWRGAVAQNQWFASYRLILNLTYLHLTKLGLSPHKRFYLCYLIMRAGQDITGLTVGEILEGVRSE